MICLLLIMTMIFINSTARAEQKIRHSDTILKEEDVNAKTKAWLLMVESGKVDQEELRRITPKSIFIAPLLTSRVGKCKEGYRHDHLGQCVKVIKIDPEAQLRLLLQRLNKLYGGKKEEKKEKEKEEDEEEFLKVSSGPLHFSLPISTADETNNKTKLENQNITTVNNTTPTIENAAEFIPIPLPMVYLNQTSQTKEIESSGAEPLNDTEQYGTSQIEGSGMAELAASGDDSLEEVTTTVLPVSLLPEETDYFDGVEKESTTASENQSTTEPPSEEVTSTKETFEMFQGESYQNMINTLSVNDSGGVLPKENVHVQKEIIVKNKPKSDKIHFPSDDNNYYDGLRSSVNSFESSRIRFPDEVPQSQVTNYRSHFDVTTGSTKYQSHPSEIPVEKFWWLPKNWQVDESQQRSSALMKVWSRLPLMHDITYSSGTPEGFKKHDFLNKPQSFSHQNKKEEFSEKPNQQRQPQSKTIKPFRHSRFQEIIQTSTQNFGLLSVELMKFRIALVAAKSEYLQVFTSTESFVCICE